MDWGLLILSRRNKEIECQTIHSKIATTSSTWLLSRRSSVSSNARLKPTASLLLIRTTIRLKLRSTVPEQAALVKNALIASINSSSNSSSRQNAAPRPPVTRIERLARGSSKLRLSNKNSNSVSSNNSSRNLLVSQRPILESPLQLNQMLFRRRCRPSSSRSAASQHLKLEQARRNSCVPVSNL